MSECGASLAGLRQADNFSANLSKRTSLISKRCDCRISNGLDSVCNCTDKPARKSKATRSEASVSTAAPPPRRIFAQTKQALVPIKFNSTAPRMGINLNGDTIPIPARYKYRRFPAVPDPNNQLHWMVRPETPPKPDCNPRNYHRFEESVPHHRRSNMMSGTGEHGVRPHPMAEPTQPQQCYAENDNNFHGPETNAGHLRAESCALSGNPPQQDYYMYRANRGYDYDQINNHPCQASDCVGAQAQATAHSYQEGAPASHPVHEPMRLSVPAQVPESNSVQGTYPVQAQVPESYSVQGSYPVQASHAMQEATTPRASHAPAQEPIQPSHPYHEAMPTSESVPFSVPTPTGMQDRPATASDGVAPTLEGESVATSRAAAPSHESHGQQLRRDLPPCPDRFYPCAHC